MLRSGIVAVAVVFLATGCAVDRPTGSATPSGPTSTAGPVPSIPALPTLGPPTGPPKSPSDPYPVDVLVGRIVSASQGPCYRLETDDGVVYAVHSPTAGRLAAGTTVRVHTATTTNALACGAGRPVDAEKIEVVS